MDDDLISNFVAMTGASEEMAQSYLEMANFDMETAVNYFYEYSGGAGQSSTAAGRAGGGFGADEEVRAPIPQTADVLVEPGYEDLYTSRTERATNQWQQRDSRSVLHDLYGLPEELLPIPTFDYAKSRSKSERKPILVDMQSDSVFVCSCLTRDIWKNKEIMQLLQSSFIFAQYAEGSSSWERFRGLYSRNFDGETFPFVALVHPITHQILQTWAGEGAFPSDPSRPLSFEPREFRQSLLQALRDNGFGHLAGESSRSRAVDEVEGSGVVLLADDDLTDDEDVDNILAQQTHTAPIPLSLFDSIEPDGGAEPGPGPDTTEIMFRFPNGARKKRRFNTSDLVRKAYAWIKADPPDGSLAGAEFTISDRGTSLLPKLDQTIDEAGLKRKMVLVEPVQA